MLIESKVKVTRIIEGKTKNVTETYIVDKDFFAEAEYAVTEALTEEANSNLIESFVIQSQKMSMIKELYNIEEGDCNFIATLKDIFTDDNGNEKHIRYKILLWANNLTEANTRLQALAREGYDMQIEGLKQVDYIYLGND